MKTSPTLHAKAPPFIGHGKTPLIPPDPMPDAGEGPLVSDAYGGPILEQYPEHLTKIELMCWHNYHLNQPMPKLFPSIEENQKMWQSIHVDRMLDYMPVHEIHAKNLPDYHFWPAIMNDVDYRARGQWASSTVPYDATDIPRFHKNGIPKTPIQEQVWYVPRLPDGRFDFKRNAIQNAKQMQAYCSEDGWNARYLRRFFRPWLTGRQACKQARVRGPRYFVHQQRTIGERYVRWLKGGWVVYGFVYLPFYGAALCYAGGNAANYQNNYWPGDGPWNPDTMYLGRIARDRGAYHQFI